MTNENTENNDTHEPLHPVAVAAAQIIATNRRTLEQSEAEALQQEIAALPDDELGEALMSLHRVAGYFHEVLELPAVSAQLLVMCHEMTSYVRAASARIKERRRNRENARTKAFRRIADLPDANREVARVGTKPALSVRDLNPPTRFN